MANGKKTLATELKHLGGFIAHKVDSLKKNKQGDEPPDYETSDEKSGEITKTDMNDDNQSLSNGHLNGNQEKYSAIDDATSFVGVKTEILGNFRNLCSGIIELEKHLERSAPSQHQRTHPEFANPNRVDEACLRSESLITRLITSKERALMEENYLAWRENAPSHLTNIISPIDMAHKYQRLVIKSFETLKENMHHLLLLDATENRRVMLYIQYHKSAITDAKMFLLNAISHFYMLPVDENDSKTVSACLDMMHQT